MKVQLKVATAIVSFLFGLVTLTGCQSGLKTRRDMQKSPGPVGGAHPAPSPHLVPIPPPPEEPAPVALPPAESFLQKETPKVGLILGGGGMRAWAHVGVLREFSQARIPIHNIVGLEWGAVVGAMYAHQGQVNEVEWKMMKLQDDELPGKGFLSTRIRPESIQKLKTFWQEAFSNQVLDKYRVDYACGTYSLQTEKLFWLNRGSARDAMSKCVPYPPYFTETGSQIAAPLAIEEAATYLRARGANLIIFVNPLAEGELFPEKMQREQYSEHVLWAEVRRHAAQKRLAGVNMTLPIATGAIGLLDFDERRNLIEMGSKAAREHVNKLASQYGF